MVALSDRDRTMREVLEPEFFRKRQGGAEVQAYFFQTQLANDRVIALVDMDGERLAGFAIATLMAAPPVYDPGGLTVLIDDFALDDQGAWESVGLALLEQIKLEGKSRGGVGLVTVCARGDENKHRWLDKLGARVVSEWHFLRL